MSTTDKKLGVRWGLAGGVALSTVDQVREVGRWAGQVGFDSYWVSQGNAVDPIVALAAAAPELNGLDEVGTSVVPLYGRHPIGVAQSVRTAQSALGGRFTLGIGPSHRSAVEDGLGIGWDRPYRYTEEFIDGLDPLLAGSAADVVGTQIVTRGELNITAADTPVLLAALGPKMLALAGRRTAGTTVGQCGPKTVSTHIAPLIRQAAADAGQPKPRIMALIRLCVTTEIEPAYNLAREVGAFYAGLPSYAAMLAKEGVADPADLHLIGSKEQVFDGLGRYAEAGVTDFRLEVAAPSEKARASSMDALAGFLS